MMVQVQFIPQLVGILGIANLFAQMRNRIGVPYKLVKVSLAVPERYTFATSMGCEQTPPAVMTMCDALVSGQLT